MYVTSLLFAMSQEISRVGGHTLDKSIISELSSSMFQGVLKCYQSVLKKSPEQTTSDTGTSINMPQQCALQLVFNLKFLANILVAESDTEVYVQIFSTFNLKFKHVFDLSSFCVWCFVCSQKSLVC